MKEEPVFLIAIVLIVLLGISFLLPTSTEQMRVSSKSWQYTIKELEDYKVWVCREECSGIGEDEECENSCGWETRTKTHNTWITGSIYPTEPFWETNYSIRTNLGYYEKRWQSYSVVFKNETDSAVYHPFNLNDYNSYRIGSQREVKLNIYRSVVQVGKAQ